MKRANVTSGRLSATGRRKKIIICIVFLCLLIFVLALQFNTTITAIPLQQLSAIKSGELAKAYGMTSTSFQQQVALEDFKNYIDNYSVLKANKSIKFTENSIENNLGYLNGTLEAEDGSKMQIEYQLIKEDGHWKIQSMRLAPDGILTHNESDTVDSAGASIHAVLVNDTVNGSGYVEQSKMLIPKTANKIYATVKLVAPRAGAKIKATLIHIPSGEKAGPFTDEIKTTGNTTQAFTFTRSKHPWQVGEYEVDVTLSSGSIKAATFQVQ